MRHYAEELRINNWQINYQIVENFDEGLFNTIQKYSLTEIRTITPCDRTFLQSIKNLKLNCEVKLYPNPNFLWQPEEFKQWADKRKRLILEDFYRESRKRWQILLTENNQPVGGKWNLDKENRKPPKNNLSPPQPLVFKLDNITKKSNRKS